MIPFNVWDDYYDDGHVPEGEIQETYGYVEDDVDWTEEERCEIAKLVTWYCQTEITLPGVVVGQKGEDVEFKHLTHTLREKLLNELQNSGLNYKGKSFDFYSES
jgi:hypothetical protein